MNSVVKKLTTKDHVMYFLCWFTFKHFFPALQQNPCIYLTCSKRKVERNNIEHRIKQKEPRGTQINYNLFLGKGNLTKKVFKKDNENAIVMHNRRVQSTTK